jgi:hypothetical protein
MGNLFGGGGPSASLQANNAVNEQIFSQQQQSTMQAQQQAQEQQLAQQYGAQTQQIAAEDEQQAATNPVSIGAYAGAASPGGSALNTSSASVLGG